MAKPHGWGRRGAQALCPSWRSRSQRLRQIAVRALPLRSKGRRALSIQAAPEDWFCRRGSIGFCIAPYSCFGRGSLAIWAHSLSCAPSALSAAIGAPSNSFRPFASWPRARRQTVPNPFSLAFSPWRLSAAAWKKGQIRVRKEAGSHKFLHVAGNVGELNVSHCAGYFIDFFF